MEFPPLHVSPGAYRRQRQRMRAAPRWAIRRWGRMPPNLRGTVLVLCSAVLFTVMQVIVKLLGGTVHPFEIAFFRALTSVLFIGPLIWRLGPAGFKTTRPGLMIIRGISGASAMLCGFYAIAHLPLADATSISFSRALFVVPLAVLFLGESIGPRRLVATLVGFGGVLIISWPSGTMEPGTMAAIGNAFFVAAAIIFVKILSRTDSTTTLLFYSGVFGMIATAIPASLYWQWPDLRELLLLVCMGGAGIMAQSCFIRAYSIGEATALAPLDYTRILFSTAAGFFIFATVPGWQTAVGAVIIAGSTLYITLREARKADVAITPAEESGAPTEPLDYALRQKEERDMVERGAGE